MKVLWAICNLIRRVTGDPIDLYSRLFNPIRDKGVAPELQEGAKFVTER